MVTLPSVAIVYDGHARCAAPRTQGSLLEDTPNGAPEVRCGEGREFLALEVGWPSWVGVVAEDLDAQRRFYRDVLGLTELAAGLGWVQFDFGDKGVLELVQRSGEPQYDHARYQVGYTVADLESARDTLVSRGVRPVTEIEGDAQAGGRWCYFLDAEDNIFEIKERREQPPH